jgi:hypothetical protein
MTGTSGPTIALLLLGALAWAPAAVAAPTSAPAPLSLRVAWAAPGADTARPKDFVDNRFVDERHRSGFIQQSKALD